MPIRALLVAEQRDTTYRVGCAPTFVAQTLRDNNLSF